MLRLEVIKSIPNIASIAGIETIVFITTQRDWLAILRPY